MQRVRPPAQSRQTKAQATPPTELRFSVRILPPKAQERITTHVIAFRGLLWAAAKGAPAASGEADAYDITLPWHTRPLKPLEKLNQDAANAYRSTNQSTVSLEFHYKSDETKEHRFTAAFDAKKLLQHKEVTVKGRNNNFYTGNPAIDSSDLPEKYRVTVTLTATTNTPDANTFTVTPEIPLSMERNSIKACDFIDHILTPFMTHETPFQNIRTFVRYPKFCCFFTHLPMMWSSNRARLPVTVPVYMTLNALLMNDFDQDTIAAGLDLADPAITTPRLLRLIRDITMGFTMCKKEGEYTGDTLFDIEADDQPFCDALHCHDDVYFSPDDCEGRLQQGKLVHDSLYMLHSLPENAIVNALDAEGTGLLQALAPQTKSGLIRTCKTLSALLQSSTLQFEMVVGEARFPSFHEGAMESKAAPVGHSFGLLTLDAKRSTAAQLEAMKIDPHRLTPGMHVIEATGWMDEFKTTKEATISKEYKRRIRERGYTGDNEAQFRSCTTLEQCDRVYCYMYMINDCMVFTYDTRAEKWVYGGTPTQYLRGETVLLTPKELIDGVLQNMTTTPSAPPRDTRKPAPPRDTRTPASPPQPDKTNDASKTAICKQAHDFIQSKTHYNANDVEKRAMQLQAVDTAVAQNILFIHPPPEPENTEKERLQRWAEIREKHIPIDVAEQRIAVAFTLPTTARRPPVPRNMELKRHPFMQSMVYTLRPLVD